MIKKIKEFFYPKINDETRLYLLDTVRGFAVFNMILFHLFYNLVYLCGISIPFFESKAGEIWQFMICSCFIFLSGLFMNISSHPFKRGFTVLLCSVLVTVVTLLIIPEERIIFGVLTFLGFAMLFIGAIKPLYERINPVLLLIISLILFVRFKEINSGYISFAGIELFKLPECFYHGYLMTFLGFTDIGFFSSDYFSFFPWIFLFTVGYAFGRIVNIRKQKENRILRFRIPVLNFLGQRALIIYLIHQPILYLIVLVING